MTGNRNNTRILYNHQKVIIIYYARAPSYRSFADSRSAAVYYIIIVMLFQYAFRCSTISYDTRVDNNFFFFSLIFTKKKRKNEKTNEISIVLLQCKIASLPAMPEWTSPSTTCYNTGFLMNSTRRFFFFFANGKILFTPCARRILRYSVRVTFRRRRLVLFSVRRRPQK